MNKPEDNIEKLFQSHINDFDKMPDDSLWADIEANLPPVETPVRKLWRWGLAAALLLFSLIGYVAYQSLDNKQNSDIVGVKENTTKPDTDAQKSIPEKDTKTASRANETHVPEEQATKETIAIRAAENDKTALKENKIQKDKIASDSKSVKSQKAGNSIWKNPVTKSSELIVEKQNIVAIGKKPITAVKEPGKEIAVMFTEDNNIKANETISREIGEANNEQKAIANAEMAKGFSDVDYLNNRNDVAAHAIPFNTRIACEAEVQPQETRESFFKVPAEVYVSLTPSLNYYRVFSNAVINQFNGANNGGRVGWAVQAGAVYPLKLRRLSYRVGLSFFSAQSNFKYNLISGKQVPVRLDNNTFEYVNLESLQTESKKWQVLEIQNDLMYKVRPMQDFILGFKAGSSFTERPVFDAYTGYRFSKQVSHRQILWIETAYAYAINAQKSSYNTFSYHMDKYSLRIGLNFK
ncbi:hypothetical protein [Emticicia agri]|uniref:Outer membrane protein beta-barrel domain-containing protein n=1 Tax=Emticicia agri TaxID=2492393 RepID=A0A4Q5M3H0_9BACT|nr:hypothetical protein [Emticicia agri]RYU96926.1 hypothetical protein EWM59_05200 [Emticicia agri]